MSLNVILKYINISIECKIRLDFEKGACYNKCEKERKDVLLWLLN